MRITSIDFMQRCLQLAGLGGGWVAPNPMVGAVLVHEGRIIGEGYHRRYGGPHAEVLCIGSVKDADRQRISDSSLYVSLEPCVHHGKTPPCTDLILQENIKHVVIGCRDPFPEVDGRGIEKLTAHGVRVEYPVMEEEAIHLNRRFFTFHQKKRPYVILKWAQSANGKMSAGPGERIQISNAYSNRLVHKWRSEEAGILVGTNTALQDDPALTTRLWTGKNPVRIVLDSTRRLPGSLKIFDGTTPTVILHDRTDGPGQQVTYKKISSTAPLIPEILSALYSMQIQSVLVEGGARLLQTFLDSGIWDELRIITNHDLQISPGISSPDVLDAEWIRSETFDSDEIKYFVHR